MSRPRKSSIEREAMHERLLTAAGELLETQGVAGVSIRAVTARLDVSPMTFYSYFRSREELLKSLSERQLRILQEKSAQFLVRAEQEGARSVLHEVIDLFTQSAFQRPYSYLLQWAVPADQANGNIIPHRLFETGLQFLSDLIDLGVRQGEFRVADSQQAALTLFSLFTGPLLLHTSGRLSDPLQLTLLLQDTERMAVAYLGGRDAG